MLKRTLVLLASAGAVSAFAVSSASAAPLSPTALKACQNGHLMHTLCANGGHYTMSGGRRVFELNTQLTAQAHTSALGYQYLNNQGNVRCLSKFGTTANWTGMYICNLSANQTWNIQVFNANTWTLQNKGNGNCLNVRYGQPTVGQVLITYLCNTAYNERFFLNSNWPGFTIRAATQSEFQGAQGLSPNCVSSYGSGKDGAPAQLAGCNGSANQTWGRV